MDLSSLDGAVVYNVTINENYPNHGTGLKNTNGWLKNFKLYDSTFSMDHGNNDSFSIETYNFYGDSDIFGCTFNQYISLNGGAGGDGGPPLAQGSTWNLKIHDNVFNLAGISPTTQGNEFSLNYLDIYNNYFNSNGTVPAASLWTTNYLTSEGVTNWTFHNNVVFDCGQFGVSAQKGGTLKNVSIANNVFDTITSSPYSGYGVTLSGFTGTWEGTNLVENNVFLNDSAASASLPSGILFDYNMTYGSGNNDNPSGGTVGAHNLIAAPGFFANGSAKPSPYYTAASASSNLVGAGTNWGLPSNSSDIGAYDYSSTSNAAPAAPSGLSVQ